MTETTFLIIIGNILEDNRKTVRTLEIYTVNEMPQVRESYVNETEYYPRCVTYLAKVETAILSEI
jgi:hypothetical protein